MFKSADILEHKIKKTTTLLKRFCYPPAELKMFFEKIS